jgi:hypothetical protein
MDDKVHHFNQPEAMNDKVIKLQLATDQAEATVNQCFASLQESKEAVRAVKALLQHLDEEEQQRIKVSDTKLPELLAMLQAAQDAHETAVKRYETNKKYLELYKQKAGGC